MSYGQEDRLTLAQAMILHWIRVNSPYPSVIARRLGVTPTAITGQVTRLEQLGYLTREIDPADRRRIILALTAKGQQRSNLAEEQFLQFISPASSSWSDNEIVQIQRGLELLENALQHASDGLMAQRSPESLAFLEDSAGLLPNPKARSPQ
jgi:DNA-binding MarR family transcriptional regulator